MLSTLCVSPLLTLLWPALPGLWSFCELWIPAACAHKDPITRMIMNTLRDAHLHASSWSIRLFPSWTLLPNLETTCWVLWIWILFVYHTYFVPCLVYVVCRTWPLPVLWPHVLCAIFVTLPVCNKGLLLFIASVTSTCFHLKLPCLTECFADTSIQW